MINFDEQFIIKYIEKNCTVEEVESLLDWIILSDENKEHFLTIKKLYNLKKINHYSQPLQLASALKEFNQKIEDNQKNQKRQFILKYIKYAALLVLLIGIPFLFWLKMDNKDEQLMKLYTIKVEKSSPVKIVTLPDGTKVWLNSGSFFQYPITFSKTERNVKLIGEAFFEVKTDSLHPFIVQADSMRVKVYGTSFNINTDTYDRTIQTTLVTGCIAVQNSKGKNLAVLHPDQIAIYNNQTGDVDINRVNVNLYTSWRLGLIMFEKASIYEITNKLQEFYQVNIIINKGLKNDNKYNFVFRNTQPIDEVLAMLKFVTKINYKRYDNTIYINLK